MKVVKMYNQPKKDTGAKKIEIIVIVIILAWAALFLIDYFRYTSGSKPIFAIKHESYQEVISQQQ